MLRSLKDLERYTVSATDGGIGSVEFFLLDDEHWTIRYLVVERELPNIPGFVHLVYQDGSYFVYDNTDAFKQQIQAFQSQNPDITAQETGNGPGFRGRLDNDKLVFH